MCICTYTDLHTYISVDEPRYAKWNHPFMSSSRRSLPVLLSMRGTWALGPPVSRVCIRYRPEYFLISQGAKYPNMEHEGGSIVGILMMVLSRYSIFGHLEFWGISW